MLLTTRQSRRRIRHKWRAGGGARCTWNGATVPERVVRVERDGWRARVIVDRPNVRNAFNAALIAALHETFLGLGSDPDIRSIVLSGEGKTFSGGADIGWMRDALALSEDENVEDAAAMAAMFRAIDRCPKLVIARVHGAALGGGCGLIAAADIAVAADDAFFGFPEVTLGLIPGVISPYVIAKIGASHARALFLTGTRFDARRAHSIGLVHDVVPADQLDTQIDAIVREFAAAGPEAVAAAKALVAAVAQTSDDIDAYTARAIAQRRVSAEGQEGLRAFLERRSPLWNEG